jgi:glycosyltransferase involved in cell wall biosynthesis
MPRLHKEVESSDVMRKPRLSLCMIARDEEKWIAACLDSVRDVADEMIVVDTGSRDATPELAERCGARVYAREWRDDFAEARNYSLEQASGDWIFWLDADERLDPAGRESIRAALESDLWLASLLVVNYYGPDPPDPARSNRWAQYRLFRNSPKLRFRGAIHEQLVRVPELTASAATHLPAVIHHYGYMDGPVREKNKSARNLRLIRQSMEREPDYDPWLDYHAASELYRLGRFDEALAFVRRAAIRFLEWEKTPTSLLYRLKYAALLEAGRHEEAERGIDAAIRLYPDYTDLHLYRGIILLHRNRTMEALEAFRHCLRLGDGGAAHLTCHGAGSFQAWYYIGRCLRRLGRTGEAWEAFAKALELRPDYAEALRELEVCGIDRDQPVHDRQG